MQAFWPILVSAIDGFVVSKKKLLIFQRDKSETRNEEKTPLSSNDDANYCMSLV